ncbi:MAG: hypothetical protein BWY87_01019 [Deltaproteobacteria bacterium ADurb.Bin510]|nr:MAG: hypothetical protein BWY87_01019 [Deltaproteobacteria bacterium ADurb.Bin510]
MDPAENPAATDAREAREGPVQLRAIHRGAPGPHEIGGGQIGGHVGRDPEAGRERRIENQIDPLDGRAADAAIETIEVDVAVLDPHAAVDVADALGVEAGAEALAQQQEPQVEQAEEPPGIPEFAQPAREPEALKTPLPLADVLLEEPLEKNAADRQGIDERLIVEDVGSQLETQPRIGAQVG